MQSLSAVQSCSAIQACSGIQACNGITAIPPIAVAAPAFTNTYSVDFDGTDDYANCGDLTPIEGLTAISINVWFKANSVSSRGSFVSKYSGNGQRAFTFDFNADGSIRFLKFASTGSGTNYISTKTTNTGFDDNAWHMATVTWVPGEAKIYIDGVEATVSEVVGGTGDGSDIQATTSNFYIGAAELVSTSPDFLLQGKIDEVAVFGSVLSAAQVTAIYNSGEPADLTSYSPIGWWRMGDNDGGTGTTITDQGSGGNDATLTNGPTFSTDVPT